MHFTLRQAAACDADAIANVYCTSFRLLTFLPILHTVEEYRWFISNVTLKECEVTVAEDESAIVAFLARRGEEVRLLYTRPDRIGMGAGTQLIDSAKASGIGALELWCFQANTRARRFYEARGFHAIRLTDGADNEERMPDVRYRWQRQVRAVIIKGEKQADLEAIHELVAAAFNDRTWVRPEMVVEVAQVESTPDGLLRHVVYQGERGEKLATVVRRDRPN